MIKQFLNKALEKSKAFVLSTTIRHLVIKLCKRLEKKDPAGRLYIDLTKNDGITNQLKTTLTKIGCFRFFSTNSGEYRIGISQIVYFVYIGFKLLFKNITVSKFTHQVHHKNSVVGDSYNPANLVLLTIEDHLIVTKIQNATLDVHCYEPEVEQEAVRYNNQGHKVKDVVEYLNGIIADTLYATERWLIKLAAGKGRVFSVKKAVSWIERHLTKVKDFLVFTGLKQTNKEWLASQGCPLVDNSAIENMLDNLISSLGMQPSRGEVTLNDMLVDLSLVSPQLATEAIADEGDFYF